MKRVYITTILTCIVLLVLLMVGFKILDLNRGKDHLTIGFIYDNDESTPYTYNFSLAKDAVEKKYASQVEIFTCSNVLEDEIEELIPYQFFLFFGTLPILHLQSFLQQTQPEIRKSLTIYSQNFFEQKMQMPDI